MKAGSMEGLIGASQNIKMVDVPMRIYKEAERKGDTATMERALGYAGEYTQKAYKYKEKVQDELIKELKEEKLELEENRKEQLEENEVMTRKDGVEIEISEEGKELNEENVDNMKCDSEVKIDIPKNYNKNGDVITSLKENIISIKI